MEQVRRAVENDLGCEVQLVESNSYGYLLEMNKKEGDEGLRRST